ncbi:MAG: hypothetical protein JWN15_1945, partial [Firmicutes bacterium]|nr:hypothetical protein [Bacillota bacterium]
WMALPIFCCHVAATSVAQTVGGAAVSDRVDSTVRATALSVLSMADSLSDTAGILIFGQISTIVSMRASWLAGAAVVALTAPLMLLRLPGAPRAIDGGDSGPGREVEAL